MTHVVCLGDLMVDVLARLPGPLAPGSDTAAPIEFHGGGAAVNVAAWAVAAGGRATFVGRVGDDALGERGLAELRHAGVEAAVTVDPDRPTGTCIVLVAPDGERTMVPSAGANAVPVDLSALPAAADWLYVSGYSLLRASTRAAAVAAMDHARRRGWAVAVDAASEAPLAEHGGAAFLDLLGHGDLLLANTAEAAVLTGRRDAPGAAKALAARTGGTAVVKCGADGAAWSDGSDVLEVPAVAADVVDSTGAGDAFAAGFLTCAGPVYDRLVAAAALAARSVGRIGARPPA
jgi:ribokinase